MKMHEAEEIASFCIELHEETFEDDEEVVPIDPACDAVVIFECRSSAELFEEWLSGDGRMEFVAWLARTR